MSVSYLTTYPGILKIVQLLCNIIATAIIAPTRHWAYQSSSFMVASIGGIVLTFTLLVIKVSKVDRKINIPWARLEIGYCVTWIALYIITTSQTMLVSTDAYRAAGVFALFATITYVAEILERHAEMKNESNNNETAEKKEICKEKDPIPA